jgi:hypothetical protein
LAVLVTHQPEPVESRPAPREGLIEILGESWRDKHRLDTDRPDPPPSRSRRKRA